MLAADQFRSMKQGAVFISTARGGHPRRGRVGSGTGRWASLGAGLDVWTVEPPARDNPLLTLPNVTATYHTAGVTHEARRNAATMAAEQIEIDAASASAPADCQPEVWPVFLERHRQLFQQA